MLYNVLAWRNIQVVIDNLGEGVLSIFSERDGLVIINKKLSAQQARRELWRRVLRPSAGIEM